MDTLLYFCFTLFYIILLIIGIHNANKHGWFVSSNFLLLVIVGLIYDNGILAIGRYVGEGGLLESLNLARYYLHALFTPLLILFAWSTVKNAEIAWAEKTIVHVGVILITICLIIVEFATEVSGIYLEARWNYGVLSYEKTEVSNGPPIMVISVSALLLITSLLIWWKQKWIWFFIGTTILVIGSAVNLTLATNAIHNFYELILIITLTATKLFQSKQRR